MNAFEKAIGENRISSEDELKRLFWKCAKRIHPDVSSLDSNHERFIQLKNDFDEAAEILRRNADARTSAIRQQREAPPPVVASRAACISLFVDLLAGNFPADHAIRDSNKTYRGRIISLNEGLGSCDPAMKGVFLEFENEMYALKGATTVSNHPFNVVKLYLYRFGDYTWMPNITNRNFLNIGYALVRGIFAERNMKASIAFVDWLVGDIVTKETKEHQENAR